MLRMGLSATPVPESAHPATVAVAAPSAADRISGSRMPAGATPSCDAGMFQALIGAGGQDSASAEPALTSVAEHVATPDADADADADADVEAAEHQSTEEGREGLSLIQNLLQWLRGPLAATERCAAGVQAQTPMPLTQVDGLPDAQAPAVAAPGEPESRQFTAAPPAGTGVSTSDLPRARIDLGPRRLEGPAPLENADDLLPVPPPSVDSQLPAAERVMAPSASMPAAELGPMSAVPAWAARPFEVPASVSAQTPVPPPPPPPLSTDLAGWPQALGERIAWSVDGDLQDAVIELHPAELGSLTIRVETRGADAQVTLIAGTAAARDLLQQSLPQLRELMLVQGLNLARAQVERPATAASPEQAGFSRGRSAGPAGSRRRISQLLLVDTYA